MAAPQMLPFVWFDFLAFSVEWADRHVFAAVLLVIVVGGAVAFALARLIGFWLRPLSDVPLPPAEPLRFTPRPWGQPAPKGFKSDRTRAVADMRSQRA